MVRGNRFTPIPPDKIFKSKKWIPVINKNYRKVRQTALLNEYRHINKYKRDKRGVKKQTVLNTNTQKSKQIHLFPTDVQKQKILIWMEIYRQTYNITLNYIKKLEYNDEHRQSFQKTRPIVDSLIKNKHNILTDLYTSSEMTKHIRDEAINDVFKAYKTAIANKKANNITHFRIRYKKIANMLAIEANYFSKRKNAFCIKSLGEMKSDIPFNSVLQTCRLVYNIKTKQFMLYVPIIYNKQQKVHRYNICALDPGIRTFQTIYSPQHTLLEFGYIDKQKSNPIHKIKHIDKKLQNIKKHHGHKKYENRLRRKIRNVVINMHWKTARQLCLTFDNILLGNMSTKSIIKRENHLHASVKRLALYLSHFTFKQRLIHKCNEFGVKFQFVDESYTTKTCGRCGKITNIGAAEVFRCSNTNCGFNRHNITICRDFNAARNIYLKNR